MADRDRRERAPLRARPVVVAIAVGMATLLPVAAGAEVPPATEGAGPSAPVVGPPEETASVLLPAPDPEPAPSPLQPPVATPAPPRSPPPPTPPRPAAGVLAGARFILGVERAFGGVFWRSTLSAAPSPATGNIRISWDREDSSGHLLSLLGTSASYGELSEVAAPSLLPRVAADVVLGDRFTAGGAVGYFSSTGTRDVMSPSGTTAAGDPDRSGLLLAPRVGYLLALAPHIALWLRAGFSYASTTVKQVDETAALITREVRHLNASLDPALLWSPVPHLGFLVNPFADLGLAGRRRVAVDLRDDHAANQAGFRWSGYGLSLALCGFL